MTERPPLLYGGPRTTLLRRVSTLSLDDLHALDAAVRGLVAEKWRKDVNKGYYFAWSEGPRLDRAASAEIEELFALVLAALAGGLTGLDVERFGARFAPRPSLLGGFADLFRPPSRSRRLQDASIGLITDAVAPWDPQLAIIATWNMACAAALRQRLPERTIETLEGAWRRALGEPPI